MKAWQKFLGVLLFLIVQYFISWAFTAGVLWCIFALLDKPFSLKVATGIWLAAVLIQSIIRGTIKGK